MSTTSFAVLAAGNAALDAVNAYKVSQILDDLRDITRNRQRYIDYITNLVEFYRSKGMLLATTTTAEPGSDNFEKLLQAQLQNDMVYHGQCNADIFTPINAEFSTRKILGRFKSNGYVESKGLPEEMGLIWATGCKNAQDAFRSAKIKLQKQDILADINRSQNEDIKTLDLAVKYSGYLFTFLVIGLIVKIQFKLKEY